MKNLTKRMALPLITFAVLGLFFIPFSMANAVDVRGEFGKTIQKAGLSQTEDIIAPDVAIGKIINTVLTYVGVITLALVIYAGAMWATARGNEKQVENAKKMLMGGVIGLIIIFSAAILVSFVISQIGTAVAT